MEKQDGKEFTTTSLEVTTNQAAPSSSISSPSSSVELVLETRQDQKWKKPTESWFMVQQLLGKGFTPRKILSILYPKYCSSVSDEIPDVWLLQLIRELCEQRTRKKLPEFNTFEDAVELFQKSSRILVVSGAGVSVSCGIPDFRSENGVYARLKKDFPELPTPSAMFDIDFFRRNPAPFYNFAREIFPGQFRPSVSHMFVKFLEEQGKLLRNYTQNIDTLEQVAGIRNLVECHGSFARSACLQCKNEIDSEELREQVFSQMSGNQKRNEAQTEEGKSQSLARSIANALQRRNQWADKDELLDVLYWGRQFVSLVIGVCWGVIPLRGILALILYVAISTGIGHSYLTWYQEQDDEEFGGFWEIAKEGFGAAFATFMVSWITVYSTMHFD